MSAEAIPKLPPAEVYNLRLPAGLKAELTRVAAVNQRSLNGEIIWRLQRSLEGQHAGTS